MSDRNVNEAAIPYLIAEGASQLEGKAAASFSHPAFSDPESELGAKVQRAVQQGVELVILDGKGRLQREGLIARGLLVQTAKLFRTSLAGGFDANHDDCHGPPGSGKSTLFEEPYFRDRGVSFISGDTIERALCHRT